MDRLPRSSCPASYSEFRDIHEKLLRRLSAKLVRVALLCRAESAVQANADSLNSKKTPPADFPGNFHSV